MLCVVPSGNLVVRLPSSPNDVTEPSGFVTCTPLPRSVVVVAPSGPVVVNTPESGSKRVLLPSGNRLATSPPDTCVLPPVGMSNTPPPEPAFNPPRLPRSVVVVEPSGRVVTA